MVNDVLLKQAKIIGGLNVQINYIVRLMQLDLF